MIYSRSWGCSGMEILEIHQVGDDAQLWESFIPSSDLVSVGLGEMMKYFLRFTHHPFTYPGNDDRC